jgi:hypothetical protein
MAHQKSTSKKAAAAAPRTMQGKGSAKGAKSAGGPALKPAAGQKKGGKRKA